MVIAARERKDAVVQWQPFHAGSLALRLCALHIAAFSIAAVVAGRAAFPIV